MQTHIQLAGKPPTHTHTHTHTHTIMAYKSYIYVSLKHPATLNVPHRNWPSGSQIYVYRLHVVLIWSWPGSLWSYNVQSISNSCHGKVFGETTNYAQCYSRWSLTRALQRSAARTADFTAKSGQNPTALLMHIDSMLTWCLRNVVSRRILPGTLNLVLMGPTTECNTGAATLRLGAYT